jgi:uncharacterized protein (TIRG00374 family)
MPPALKKASNVGREHPPGSFVGSMIVERAGKLRTSPRNAVTSPGKTSRTALRIAFAALGSLAIAILVRQAGWSAVRAYVGRIGPWFPALVALNVLMQSGFVLALRSILRTGHADQSFFRLYRIYWMGDAGNYLIPGGGEAVKALLLSELGGGAEAAAVLTLHKQAELAAQCTFAVIGVGATVLWFHLSRAVAAAALAGTLLLLALLLLFTRALGRSPFSGILRRLARWPFLAKRFERLHAGARDADSRIAAFHAHQPGRFAAASAFCLLGYAGGLLETWLVLRLLAPAAGWPSWLAVEALPMVLNNAVLFIPGKLGGAEGIRTGVFLLIGLSASQGAAFAILRRARELAWVLPGWLLLALERFRSRRGALLPDFRGEPSDA